MTCWLSWSDSGSAHQPSLATARAPGQGQDTQMATKATTAGLGASGVVAYPARGAWLLSRAGGGAQLTLTFGLLKSLAFSPWPSTYTGTSLVDTGGVFHKAGGDMGGGWGTRGQEEGSVGTEAALSPCPGAGEASAPTFTEGTPERPGGRRDEGKHGVAGRVSRGQRPL